VAVLATHKAAGAGGLAHSVFADKFNRIILFQHLIRHDQILIVDTLTPESQIEEKELSLAVRRAVLSMPQPEKEIFLRFYYYCQTMDVISQEMHINLSTVKTKLRRGRMRLRSVLVQYIS